MGIGGAPPSARLLNHTASPHRGQPEWDRRRACWGYLKRWLETATWVLLADGCRSTYNVRRRPLVIFGPLVGRSVGPPRPGVVVSFWRLRFVFFQSPTIANFKLETSKAGEQRRRTRLESFDSEANVHIKRSQRRLGNMCSISQRSFTAATSTAAGMHFTAAASAACEHAH